MKGRFVKYGEVRLNVLVRTERLDFDNRIKDLWILKTWAYMQAYKTLRAGLIGLQLVDSLIYTDCTNTNGGYHG